MEEILDQTLMEPGVSMPVIEPETTEQEITEEVVVEPEFTYVYIKKYVPKDHIVLTERLDPNLYDNIGNTLEDFKNNKFVLLNDDQVEFLNNNPEASMEEVYNMLLNIETEPTLEEVREEVKNRIKEFDNSQHVNIFYIHDVPVWLDKATRAGLKLRFDAEIALGKTETELWNGKQSFPLQLSDAVRMLYVLEVYASECYDNTQKHLAIVDSLESIEDLKAYDIFSGYPKPIHFPTENYVSE